MYYNNMDTIETAIYPCQRPKLLTTWTCDANKGNKSRSRAPAGKRQVLIIMTRTS